MTALILPVQDLSVWEGRLVALTEGSMETVIGSHRLKFDSGRIFPMRTSFVSGVRYDSE
jgi:hypothetical protein